MLPPAAVGVVTRPLPRLRLVIRSSWRSNSPSSAPRWQWVGSGGSNRILYFWIHRKRSRWHSTRCCVREERRARASNTLRAACGRLCLGSKWEPAFYIYRIYSTRRPREGVFFLSEDGPVGGRLRCLPEGLHLGDDHGLAPHAEGPASVIFPGTALVIVPDDDMWTWQNDEQCR